MKQVTAVLIGAGQRGMGVYASYALENPEALRFVAVAEPDDERREKFGRMHGIAPDRLFKEYRDLLGRPALADAAFVCTQDRMHFEPTMLALARGYDVLLEKPMSTDPAECVLMAEQARRQGRLLSVCHVLRYTSFFTTIRGLLDAGRIGRLVSIQHNENVGPIHHSHSYVRGNFGNTGRSSPMILAKSCHDMDLILWFAGADCVKVSSFGSLLHFVEGNAPAGAPKRCLDGCPVAQECIYYAPKIYLTENTDWPTSMLSNDLSLEGRTKALKEGPYGRCVYHCDNDAVDHQVVAMEFANGVTAAFTMCSFAEQGGRTLKLMGTAGEIRASLDRNEIEVSGFASGKREIVKTPVSKYGHGGGDHGIMEDFTANVREGRTKSLTSGEVSVQSHLMAFAAERSRVEGRTVLLEEMFHA